ncbi:MAG: isocitrate lyase/PEP mutase family protein [Hyphomicrobiaceae bacterium]
MSQWTMRREALRAILAGARCVQPGSVYDAMSSRMAQHIGFEVGMVGGSSASLAVLGAPDLIVMTLTEFAEQCLRMNRSCELPIMVDADHGYGNALNVMRTVEELDTAGVAGLSIEDTDLPPAFGTGSRAQLLTKEEGVGKMLAAVSARRDSSLVIAARTSAISISDMDDTIARVSAYADTGVDAIFLVGIKTRQQLDMVSQHIKLPIILGSGGGELDDLNYLAARGVRMCLQGHHPIRAAVQATYATLKALRNGTPPQDLQGMPSKELMDIATRNADYRRWQSEYLEHH